MNQSEGAIEVARPLPSAMMGLGRMSLVETQISTPGFARHLDVMRSVDRFLERSNDVALLTWLSLHYFDLRAPTDNYRSGLRSNERAEAADAVELDSIDAIFAALGTASQFDS